MPIIWVAGEGALSVLATRCSIDIEPAVLSVSLQILLEFKVDVNVMDRWNNTPLDDAKRGKHLIIMEMLESVGAKQGSQLVKLQAEQEQKANKEQTANGQERRLSSLDEEESPVVRVEDKPNLRRSLDLSLRMAASNVSERRSGDQTVQLDSLAKDSPYGQPGVGRESGEWVPALSVWPSIRSRDGDEEVDGAGNGDALRSRVARFSRRTLM
jgi:hypothetical protein